MPQNISNWKDNFVKFFQRELVDCFARYHSGSAPEMKLEKVEWTADALETFVKPKLEQFISQTLQALATEMMWKGKDKEFMVMYSQESKGYIREDFAAGYNQALSEIRSAQQDVAKKWGLV